MPGQNEGADAHPSVRHEQPHQHRHLIFPNLRPAQGTDRAPGAASDDAPDAGSGRRPGTDDAPGAARCPTCSAPLADGTHRPADPADPAPAPPPGSTDRLLAALSASESRFRAAFCDAGIGMALLDPDDRIIEVNPAFATLVGCGVVDLVHTHIHDIIDPEGMPDRLFPELVRGDRERVRVEKQLKHREGRTVWSKVTISLIRDGAGNPQYTLAMVEDITEQQPARRPPGVPGAARPADPAPQPDLLLRPARRGLPHGRDHRDRAGDRGDGGGPAGRPSGRGLLPGPRRLRRDQRDPRPPHRRPVADRGRRPAPARRLRPQLPPGRPDGR